MKKKTTGSKKKTPQGQKSYDMGFAAAMKKAISKKKKR